MPKSPQAKSKKKSKDTPSNGSHHPVAQKLGKDVCLKLLKQMLLIRNFEVRGEAAYQQGKVGGFYHSYMGQEAIQTAAIEAMGKNNWYVTSYRCHALALLLGATPEELMAELYGRATGNARGRGGSMHFFTDRLLGGHGIVGGQIPIGLGAGLTLQYQGVNDEISVCFMGDGSVAQGSFHESLNLASLWSLPCLFVIENNQWGMGTATTRALSVQEIAEAKAQGYDMHAYTVDGMDLFACYTLFSELHEQILKTQRPVLVEALTERFRGHSISDPGLYRSKDELSECMARDPLLLVKQNLEELGWIDEETYKKMDKEEKARVVEAMRFAEESPWPCIEELEEDVFAP